MPWLDGRPVYGEGLPAVEAPRFAAFLRSLHRPAPEDAPRNPYRGVPLAHRAADLEGRMRRLQGSTNLLTGAHFAIWSKALEAPVAAGSTWIHGDLHPGNVLAKEGRISGIIDWGDLAGGDAATDLASAWMLFDEKGRGSLFDAGAGLDEATMARARGWAVFFGVVLFEIGLAGNSLHAAAGERTLRQLTLG